MNEIGAMCGECGFRYQEHKGHIIPCPVCRVEELEVVMREIATVGCMNRPDDNSWCKPEEAKHSIYCPAGRAIEALSCGKEGG